MLSKVEQTLVATLHKLEPDGRPIPHNRFQRALAKTLKTLVPAPHRAPAMEWEYGTWMGCFAGYDEVGRQLGEANVLPEWLAMPLDDKWRPFNGPGVRNGHPYNADALREMTQCWDELLLDGATLRALYCRLHRCDGQQILAAKDLYIITCVAVSISSFLLRRGDKPTPDGALPRQAAAAFKVIGGMFVATSRMLNQAHPMLTQNQLDVDEFLQYIEHERLLLSPESRACAGTERMIRQILGAVIDSDPSKPIEQGLAYLGDDAERAFNYGSLCARIDLGVLLHWRALRHYLKPLLDDSKTSTAVRNKLLQETELGIEDDIPLAAYYQVAQQMLNLFEDTAPEQELIAALPLSEQEDQEISIEAIGDHCYRIERAMRVFARQHQQTLDQLLQRKPLKLSDNAWSPAPGSIFLKQLLKVEPRLTVKVNK